MATATVTADQFIAEYANDIAFAAEEQPAQTPEAFIEQLRTAAHNLGHYAGINGAEDLETAATYLADALSATGAEQRTLLDRAVGYLANTAEMVDEYRDMV